MNLNYFSFFLIAFVPLLIAAFWYLPSSSFAKWANLHIEKPLWRFHPIKLFWMFLLSFTLVYGFINLVIHQMGFYELFFTDIMKGSEEAKQITEEFLSKYGSKHRHFGHGIFHGIINSFVFCIPFFGLNAIFGKINNRELLFHLAYWFITTTLVCGLVSQFV